MPPKLTTLRETILKHLPATVAVNGDTITVGKVWALEPPQNLPKPAWMLQVLRTPDRSTSLTSYEEEAIVGIQITDEPHVVPSTEAVTNVDEWDIDSVQAVKATIAGVPNTVLAVGTDYEVVDSDLDTALDGIKWLARRPDHNTTALVTYKHKMIQASRAHLHEAQVILHCIADPLKASQQGATQAHRATEIVEAMQDILPDWFEQTLRAQLEAVGISLSIQIDLGNPFRLKDAATLQASNEFETWWDRRVNLGTVRTVRKVDVQPKVEYQPAG